MNQINTPLKFKYNFLENKLWRIEDDYFYEIIESKQSIEHYPYTRLITRFKLAQKQWLILNSLNEQFTSFIATYQKVSNGETIVYEKKIFLPMGEAIFEFMEEDRVKLRSF